MEIGVWVCARIEATHWEKSSKKVSAMRQMRIDPAIAGSYLAGFAMKS